MGRLDLYCLERHKRHAYKRDVTGKRVCRRCGIIHWWDRTLAERFWPKVKKGNGCWEWQGGKIMNGRGELCLNGKHIAAHRLAWELLNGPIKNGLSVCHKCDNGQCVRPDHLFLGTKRDNSHDMLRKGRSKMAKLVPKQVVVIRERHRAGETVKELAADYGQSVDLIRRVVRRETWKCIS